MQLIFHYQKLGKNNMAKKVTYGKNFGIFYDAYRQYCRQYSEIGKPTFETPEIFRQ